MMNVRACLAAAAAVLLALLVPPVVSAGGDEDAGGRINGLRFLVPNAPGGGYDITARTAAKVIEETGLNGDIEVFNLPGAGGTVGLGRIVGERGNGRLAMSMGLGLVGSVYTNGTPSTLADTTPIARLTQESNVIAVGKNSPYRTIGQLIEAWQDDPGTVPVGGGSSPGGPDHLAPMLMAKAVGIDPRKVNYIPYDGGGELTAAMLGGQVGFGVSGIGETRDQIAAGELRPLAVTAPERVPGIDAPTLQESGVDVGFTNWRGIVAPPGLSENAEKKLIDLFTRLQKTPEWKDELRRNGWTDAFLPGDRFGAYIESESERVASVLKELGLA